MSSCDSLTAYLGVAERRHVARQRHGGPHVAPQATRVVHLHVGDRDVGGNGEEGQPQVLYRDVLRKGIFDAPVKVGAREQTEKQNMSIL